MNGQRKTQGYSNCSICKCRLDSEEVQCKLVKNAIKAAESKSLSKSSFKKLVQVIAFCNKYLSETTFYTKYARAFFDVIFEEVADEKSLAATDKLQTYETLFASVL
jgi:hypothetical protein